MEMVRKLMLRKNTLEKEYMWLYWKTEVGYIRGYLTILSHSRNWNKIYNLSRLQDDTMVETGQNHDVKSEVMTAILNISKGLAKDKKGGIYEVARPIKLSKLGVVCPSCKKVTRIGFVIKEQKKLRVCKLCKKTIDK